MFNIFFGARSAQAAKVEPPEAQAPQAAAEAASSVKPMADFTLLDDWTSLDDAFSSDSEHESRKSQESLTGSAGGSSSSLDDDWIVCDGTHPGIIPEPLLPPPTRFLASDDKLNFRLINQSEVLVDRPADFFRFVADHTNPNRISNFLYTAASIVTDFLTGHSATLAVERNCVHCAQAVDKTLAQFASNKQENFQLYRVAESGSGAFVNLIRESESEATSFALTAETDTLSLLKQAVLADRTVTGGDVSGEGKRACFTVSVKGRPFGHAMNFVHYDDNRSFIICGQTGTVYDLSLQADRVKFDKFYGASSSNQSPGILQVVVTGAAPHSSAEQGATGSSSMSDEGFVLV